MNEKEKSMTRRELIVSGAAIAGVTALTGATAFEAEAKEQKDSKETPVGLGCELSIYLNNGAIVRVKINNGKYNIQTAMNNALSKPKFEFGLSNSVITIKNTSDITGWAIEEL